MTFGLLRYSTANLGDEIQSIAARRFLPRVDVLLDRDALDAPPAVQGNVHAILNGWFLAWPYRWPPHDRIRPLLISMHVQTLRSRRRFWRPTAPSRILAGAGADWLRAHGPVGARDRPTLALLEERGIPAWYSGCLTLTLPVGDAPREDLVVACDLPAAAGAALRTRTRSPIVETTHHAPPSPDHAARTAQAQALLDLYGRARAVVTSRLHCALPCLALGTPVLYVPILPDRERQQPAMELAHGASLADLLAGRDGFDLDRPPANPDGWRTLAADLVARAQAFVGTAGS